MNKKEFTIILPKWIFIILELLLLPVKILTRGKLVRFYKRIDVPNVTTLLASDINESIVTLNGKIEYQDA